MTPKAQINPSSVFLVSGGAKGITAQCVIRLAQRYQCKWLLVGRSEYAIVEPTWAKDCFNESELKKRIMENLAARGEKPTPMGVQRVFNTISSKREIQKTLSTLDAAGSQAEYLSLDVTDVSLQEKLALIVERMGPITGIIHGAGNLADKLIEKKTEQDFEAIYAAKVKGLENLLSCLPISQLDYLVLFSSVAGFFGNVGQSDYAIANEILNKSAHLVKQHHPKCHVVAINWGPWDSGMMTPELKKVFALRNIEVIPTNVGTLMLVDELAAAHHGTVQVVIGSPLTPPARELDSDLRMYRIHRKLTLEANPFLQDHMIGGNPVLPAMCAASWIATTCEQLYQGYTFFSLENFKVLKGIVFDGAQADEFVMDITEITKTNSEEIKFEARVWSEKEKGKIRFHYSGQVTLRQHIPTAPTCNGFNSAQEQMMSAPSLYQNGTLFHGPYFQGVERVLNLSPKKATLQCILPRIEERQQGQFPIPTLNPYIADVLLHGVLILTQSFYQEGSLPAQIQKLEQFQHIPFNKTFYVCLEVQSKTDTAMVVDLIAHDAQGQIYTRISELGATVSKHLARLFVKATPGAREQGGGG